MPLFFFIPFLSKSPFVRLKCIISVQAFALSPLLFPNKWSQPHLFNQTRAAADMQRVVFEHKNSKIKNDCQTDGLSAGRGRLGATSFAKKDKQFQSSLLLTVLDCDCRGARERERGERSKNMLRAFVFDKRLATLSEELPAATWKQVIDHLETPQPA